jgi:cysteinyl-tRNA synthetase
MSKSLGNILLVRELLEQVPGEAVRLALLNAHYRQPLDWSDSVLLEAKRKLDRLYGTLRDVSGWETQWKDVQPNSVFLAALEDDLNTPRALAALFELTREANRSETDTDRIALAAQLRNSAELLGLLGSDPEEWFTLDANAELTGPQIEERLGERNAARKNRDFAAADRIRDELAGAGISIEDGPDGTRWRRE